MVLALLFNGSFSSLLPGLRLRGGASAQSAIIHTTATVDVTVTPTEPFEGQKPGTSGLRKKTKVFMQPNYLENFVQSIFDSLPESELRGATLVVSGDGRYHNAEAIQTICKLAAANGVARVWVGVNGLLSTPAASAVIREREGGAASGGIVLTASHNPGGEDEDFGIKYNVANGGPALEAFTDAVFERTKSLSEYKICDGLPEIDLSTPARHVFAATADSDPFFEVEIIDSTADWIGLIRQVFDLPKIKSLLSRSDMSFAFDGMHGVAGPYAHALFGEELGVPTSSLHNCAPAVDFNGGHPDPNLVYAAELVERMGLNSNNPESEDYPVLGAAADGDADRNMILGRGFFVTPSDSLALIAAHYKAIPWLAADGGLRAVARSMPTSGAVDRVAQALELPLYETPTGWKFFGNLMDSDLLGGEKLSPLLCGEESFGTGSSHVREKDGLWAVLCWLSILAHHNENTPVGSLVGVGEVVRQHWAKYGRNYYSRYDYETVDSAAANTMVSQLLAMGDAFREAGYGPTNPKPLADGFLLSVVDEFCYTDPIDGSVSANQGVRLLFDDGSRVVFRLSGTGSVSLRNELRFFAVCLSALTHTSFSFACCLGQVGATVRMYIEKYTAPEAGEAALAMETADALQPLIALGLELSQVQQLTGREAPTVIT